jgi:hypothetical protein
MWGISGLAEDLLGSQEGLCSMYRHPPLFDLFRHVSTTCHALLRPRAAFSLNRLSAIFSFRLCMEFVRGACLRNCAQRVSYICAYNTIMAPKCSDKAKRTHKILNLQENIELIKLT